MKKKIIIIVIILCIVVLAIVYAVVVINENNTVLLTTDIEAYKWNEKDTDIVFRANVDDMNIDDIYLVTTFNSKSDKKDIVETNRKDYIGEIFYCDGMEELLPASLFFIDNNYYVLFCNDVESKSYVLQNCHLEYGLSGEMIVAPSPVYVFVDKLLFEWLQEEGINELDFLFDNCTFDEAKEFYKRLSDEYVIIDEESEQITVDAYGVRNDIYYDKYIIIDFKNRTISGKDENGKTITVDGT